MIFAALRFFFTRTLKRSWPIDVTPYPKKRTQLLVMLSPDEVARLIETFDLSQASGLTFDTAIPGAAGLDGFFHGKYSVLTFFRLGTYHRLFTSRNSPFGLFGRTAAGFYTITWRPNDAIPVPIDPTNPGKTLPM